MEQFYWMLVNEKNSNCLKKGYKGTSPKLYLYEGRARSIAKYGNWKVLKVKIVEVTNET